MAEQRWLTLYDRPDAPTDFILGAFEQIDDSRRRHLWRVGIGDVDLPSPVLGGLFGDLGAHMARVDGQYGDAIAPQVSRQCEG